jgi:hypothetical protein
MKPYEIVNAVISWQADMMVHPLTCGNDSNHRSLAPEVRDDEVILRCLDCDYEQDHIPEVVLKWNT